MTTAPSALLLHFMHSGTRETEAYELQRTLVLPKYNRPLYPEAADELGDYRFLVKDRAGRLVASEGYSPLFKEWQSTLQAGDTTSTDSYEESLLIPDIPGGVLVIQRRHPLHGFHDLTEIKLDSLLREDFTPHPREEVVPVHIKGNPVNHMDIVILAEGYTGSERAKFTEDLGRFRTIMETTEPYASHLDALNITGVFRATDTSGVAATPLDEKTTPRSLFRTSHGVFDMARYMMPLGHHALAEAAAPLSPDIVIVLVNTDVFGGGAMYGQHACIAARQPDDIFTYIVRHEMGHLVGGLGDEYYTNSTYDPEWFQQNPPWQPNVSLLDASGHVKWQAQIAPSTPVPTPWDQTGYDALNEPADPKARDLTKIAQHIMAEPYIGVVGAFEGACYSRKRVYRPGINCIMFSRTIDKFCPICTTALENAMLKHTKQPSTFSPTRGF